MPWDEQSETTISIKEKFEVMMNVKLRFMVKILQQWRIKFSTRGELRMENRYDNKNEMKSLPCLPLLLLPAKPFMSHLTFHFSVYSIARDEGKWNSKTCDFVTHFFILFLSSSRTSSQHRTRPTKTFFIVITFFLTLALKREEKLSLFSHKHFSRQFMRIILAHNGVHSSKP